MRISAAQRTENENRIRASMDRLLSGEIQPGGKCDIKPLATEAAVDRSAFYGTRPYSPLRVAFERRLNAMREASQIPDPREAQIARLEAENTELKERLTQAAQEVDQLTDFRIQALARLAVQHEEITRSAKPPPQQLRSAACRRPEPPPSGHAVDTASPTGCSLSHAESRPHQ
ncbi:hypothetical protein [Streptomyces atratus]|uniref:hypothetical protein n=1 Tax=Streptomyces atratus TaxID=1893 RepID=UPI0022515A9B|nr:hypothetical protein [Streptomyces atratus]MCX5345975.1 hypothetical protein [Streptomyces atratus]